MIAEFVQKHFNLIVRVLAALALSAITAAFILAFENGLLPYSEDGDEFDTVYAIESTDVSESGES